MNWKFWKKPNRKMVKRPRLYRMSRSVMDWGLLAIKIVATVVLTVGLYDFFVLSDYFKIKHVSVQGEMEHADSETILKVAQVKTGENIFGTNLYGIAQNVRKIPWINHVQVRRQLPSALVIRVDEHKPFAVVATAGSANELSYYLMSEEGVLFKRIENVDTALPLISGFEKEKLKKFPTYYRKYLNEVFSFLKKYQTMGETQFELKQIHFDETMGITSFLWSREHQQFVKVYFGLNPDEKKISLWNRMTHTMKDENVFYSRVDLHVKGKAFARL
ncbi:MAG: hypothetical protein ACD_73C00614G0002 [uncultured bacterium]|nr:MAG: hypothetical protein ACD_73C00614G0002 [uncultured bacterium]